MRNEEESRKQHGTGEKIYVCCLLYTSSTEGSLIPVLDFYGTWNSQEPAYAYGGDEMVIDSVTMDRIGVPLLTIDARDGSVVQRVQSGSSTTFSGGIGECE